MPTTTSVSCEGYPSVSWDVGVCHVLPMRHCACSLPQLSAHALRSRVVSDSRSRLRTHAHACGSDRARAHLATTKHGQYRRRARRCVLTVVGRGGRASSSRVKVFHDITLRPLRRSCRRHPDGVRWVLAVHKHIWMGNVLHLAYRANGAPAERSFCRTVMSHDLINLGAGWFAPNQDPLRGDVAKLTQHVRHTSMLFNNLHRSIEVPVIRVKIDRKLRFGH